jgi:formyl transferase-like protein
MKLVVFCDSIHRVPEFSRHFARSGHRLVFLVCDNRNRRLRFVAAQFVCAFTRCSPADWWRLVRGVANGCVRLSLAPLGSPASLSLLERLRPDLALHAMGVIYRDPVISRCGMGILNAHIGKLPKYRGRSVMEWSLVCGDQTGITVFFIDEGIDTGRRLILYEPVSVDGFADLDAAKRHLFSQDARLYRRAVDLIAVGEPAQDNDPAAGLRFYEMSGLLRRVVQGARQPAPGHPEQPPAQSGSGQNSL